MYWTSVIIVLHDENRNFILTSKAASYILESPVSTPLSNQHTFVHIELLFLVEKISY